MLFIEAVNDRPFGGMAFGWPYTTGNKCSLLCLRNCLYIKVLYLVEVHLCLLQFDGEGDVVVDQASVVVVALHNTMSGCNPNELIVKSALSPHRELRAL